MKHLLIMLMLTLFLLGCDRGITPAKFSSSQKNFDYYHVHFQEKSEVWNDPEILAYPRAQFSWQAPGREIETIWSMRLDGTDLRETVDEELMDTPTPGALVGGGSYKRSENGRYLAITRVRGLNQERRIIDLETKQVDVIPSEAAGGAGFTWLNDHVVLFRDSSPLKAYDVLTKQVVDLSQEPEFKHLDIYNYYVRDSRNPIAGNRINKELIVSSDNGVLVFDYESRSLLGKFRWTGDSLSKDGRYWLDRTLGSKARKPLGGPRVYAFNNLQNELGRYGRSTNIAPMLINDIQTLYSKGPRGLQVAKLNDPKVIAYLLPEKGISNFSIYNTQAMVDKTLAQMQTQKTEASIKTSKAVKLVKENIQ